MYNRYRNATLLVLCFALVSVIAFNVVVDPFLVFGSPLVEGLNRNKPVVAKQQRLAKAYAIRHFRPQVIILGNSRAEMGLNPEHPAFKGMVSYNAAFPGASIYELRRYFEHAAESARLEVVVLSLDIYSFNMTNTHTSDYVDRRLASPSGTFSFYLADYVSAALTIRAISESKYTVTNQKSHKYHLNGLADHFSIYGDHRREFLKTEKHYARESLELAKRWSRCNSGLKSFNCYEDLEQILALAHNKNINLHIVFHPMHARILEVMDAAGAWSILEEWKRNIVILNSRLARIHGHEEFPLWDFADYSRITTEEVPSLLEQDNAMRWYSEDAHYRPETGDLLLSIVFGLNSGKESFLQDFGTRISLQNSEKHLLDVRKRRKVYRSVYREDASEVIGVVKRALRD